MLQKIPRYACVLAAVLVAISAAWQLALMIPSRAQQNDFAHYYVSSRLLLHGENPYRQSLLDQFSVCGFTELDEKVVQATNPPTLLYLFAPLAALPPETAFYGWALLQGVCLALIVGLTCLLLREQLSRNAMMVLGVLAVASPAVYYHFYYSQCQLLLGALLLGAFYAKRKGLDTSACLLAATAGVLKIFPLAFLPWFIWRSKRPYRTGAITVAVAGAAMLLSGPQLWIDFWTYGKPYIVNWSLGSPHGHSLTTLLMRIGLILQQAHHIEGARGAFSAVGVVAGSSMLLYVYSIIYRKVGDAETQFCLLSVAVLCASFCCWVHYHVMLIFPVAFIGVRLFHTKPLCENWPKKISWAMVVAGLYSHYVFVRADVMAMWTTKMQVALFSVMPLYAALGLFVMLAIEAERSAKADDANLADQEPTSLNGACHTRCNANQAEGQSHTVA